MTPRTKRRPGRDPADDAHTLRVLRRGGFEYSPEAKRLLRARMRRAERAVRRAIRENRLSAPTMALIDRLIAHTS